MCPPYIGGVETVIENVSASLTALGHKVQIICCHKDAEENNKQYTLRGITCIRWPISSYGIPKNSNKLRNHLTRVLRDIDILHLHNVHNPFIYFIWKAWQKQSEDQRPRLIITPHYHGTGHTLLAKTLWIPWRRIVKIMLRSACRVHAVSEYEKSLLEKDFKVDSVVIEHGVREDVLQFKWNPKDYLIYAGRIEKYKRLDYVVRLVKELRELGPKLRLVIIGKGTYLPKILSLAKKLNIDLEYKDFLPRHGYLRWLSQAVAFINLSEYEAYSIATLEATSIGVPAIIAEPWGRHFMNQSIVLVLNAKESCQYNALLTSRFLTKILSIRSKLLSREPRIRLWNQVVTEYLVKLYN
mgnify:CR=1 FL=1